MTDAELRILQDAADGKSYEAVGIVPDVMIRNQKPEVLAGQDKVFHPDARMKQFRLMTRRNNERIDRHRRWCSPKNSPGVFSSRAENFRPSLLSNCRQIECCGDK